MLKVGLIGCGFMGTMHANCYKNIPGVELAAFADLREECAKTLAEGTNATIYADGKDLIANAQVDVSACPPICTQSTPCWPWKRYPMYSWKSPLR